MNLEEKIISEITGKFTIEAYQRGYRWGKDEVEYLANKRIPQLKEIIFAFICNGMGDDSSSDDEEPAQKN